MPRHPALRSLPYLASIYPFIQFDDEIDRQSRLESGKVELCPMPAHVTIKGWFDDSDVVQFIELRWRTPIGTIRSVELKFPHINFIIEIRRS